MARKLITATVTALLMVTLAVLVTDGDPGSRTTPGPWSLIWHG
jgi:hypothetical protein